MRSEKISHRKQKIPCITLSVMYRLSVSYRWSPLSPDHYSEPRLSLHLNLESLGHESWAYHT